MVRESYSRDEVRTSRAPSWACSSRSFLLLPGSSTLSAQHHFFPARLAQPTGGCQHSSTSRTQPRSTSGEWFLLHPARPLLPAVKLDRRSGAPWAPWASKRSNFRHRHPRTASHTTRLARMRRVLARTRPARARTRQVRTTARPQRRHRFQPFLCRAC